MCASDVPDPVAFCSPPTAEPSYEPQDDEHSFFELPEYDFLGEDAYDVEGYLALLNDCAGSGDWQHAASMLEEMRSHGLPPDAACYAAALRACRRGAAGSKAAELIQEMWKKELEPGPSCYGIAIAACHEAGEEALAEELLSELRMIGPAPQAERFHLAPKIGWSKELGVMGCGAHNTLAWDGKRSLPYAPPMPCWLIPSQDDAAVALAENAAELRQRGWKILSCAPHIVDTLRNKAKLRQLAAELGQLSLLPEHYDFIATARFPCILKPAIGTFGKDTHIAESAEQAKRLAPNGIDDHWVLQELIRGHFEYSTSLLVRNGEILDWACIRYKYSMEEYVWPHVRLVEQELCSTPAEHLANMRKFLDGFSGICNFNYKLRPDGRMCIFEVNPRVGGDLAFDIPKARAREFFEKMDAMFT